MNLLTEYNNSVFICTQDIKHININPRPVIKNIKKQIKKKWKN